MAEFYPTRAKLDLNAKIGSSTTNAFIPTNGIWVAPIKPGRFEFIASGTKVQTVVLIIRLIRSTPKNYSTGFTNTSYLVQFNNDWSTGMVGFAISGTSVVYYGLEITQADIDAGYEYFITNDADMTGSIFGYPTIFYLDIGTDAKSSGDDDTKIVITNFDFVTKDSSGSLTKIKSYNETSKTYEANSNYVLSEVTFKISDMTGDTTTLAFRRLNDTVGVYYYQSPTVLTPSTSGTKKASTKEDCTSA